jgi:hypothetical protein
MKHRVDLSHPDGATAATVGLTLAPLARNLIVLVYSSRGKPSKATRERWDVDGDWDCANVLVAAAGPCGRGHRPPRIGGARSRASPPLTDRPIRRVLDAMRVEDHASRALLQQADPSTPAVYGVAGPRRS